MRPVGVHHVSINVSDVDEAVRFYVDVLGLTQRGDRPELGIGGAWLDAGSQQVHLLEAPPPASRGQHFAVQVDDLPAVVAELRSRGIGVSDASRVGTGLQAFVNDPSGNTVELHQPNAV
ncbi:MAG TPA: VOC family protein [Acidimicrobiia bacterium]|nr:VOC family protein [Acidimicrobiia bacterium]